MPAPRNLDEDARRTEVYGRLGETKAAAEELDINWNTYRTWIRNMKARARADMRPVEEVIPLPPTGTRARLLQAELRNLMTHGRWPVSNPEVIAVKTTLRRKYDDESGTYGEPTEGAPQTRLSGTPLIEPIVDCRGRTFLFTGAQNDAELHEGFWRNLTAYAAAMNAEIVVGPWTYETAWFSESDPASRSYAPEIQNHLCYGQLAIGTEFVFAGEINVLPTAAAPLTGLTNYSRGRWAVFPHSKIALESIPSTDPTVQAHHVMTTGACTRPQVIPRAAGMKSLFHHCIGATIVEFDDAGRLFCRQINAEDSGRFQDLDAVVDRGRVTYAHRTDAVVFGDIHTDKLGTRNAVASFGYDPLSGGAFPGSLMDTLRPRHVLAHDLHDHAYGNHHRVGDIGAAYQAATRGRVSVKDEVTRSARLLEAIKRPWSKVVVVESNHDLALERYIKEGRHRGDGINGLFGARLEAAYLEHKEAEGRDIDAGRKTTRWSMFEHALREIAGKTLKHVAWAYDGESYLINGIEVGHHGFRGVNGSKGTHTGFARMGRKMTVADKHGPCIRDGVYGAGVMELQHGYNRGPSTWSVTHVIHYANGKRTLVTLQEGRWRAARRHHQQERLAA